MVRLGTLCFLTLYGACLATSRPPTLCGASPTGSQPLTTESAALRLELQPSDLSFKLLDKQTGAQWVLSGPRAVLMDKSTVPLHVVGRITQTADGLSYGTDSGLEFHLRLNESPGALDYSFQGSFQPFGFPEIDEVDLFADSLQVIPPAAENYYVLASRLGVQMCPEGDQPFTRRMPPYLTGLGYSMSMFGAVKNGSALLMSWDSIEAEPVINYSGAPQHRLTAGLAMRGEARSARLQPLGRGGYVEIAKAYREIAKKRGLIRTVEEKLRQNPAGERLIGAADFKPFTIYKWAPRTPYNDTDQWRIQANFSFEDIAAMAEHFNKDLGIDRAMVVIAGWINQGYDGAHPDILSASPESGGNSGLIQLSRRVKCLHFLFGLHDNYTDMYRDAPSWSDDYIAKGRDGSLVKGGIWAGGQAYLICQKKSLALARRPQNIPGVLDLFLPDVYFIDCLFAMPPRVCEDPRHPVTKTDDVQLKLDLCDYARSRGLLFGSEEGNETGVAHADYFEGILGQKTASHTDNAETVIPLFELVFGDCVSLYTHQAERLGPDNQDQFLDHILYAEMPVYRFGTHRYWADPAQDFKPEAGSEARLIFARGQRWGFYDRFIRNTYNVLSPLRRLTATLPMTDHQFLTADRKVERTRFGGDVEITVNYGSTDFVTPEAVLPRYGFLVKSPTLVAFYARRYGRVVYTDLPLIVLRSRDGQPLSSTCMVSVYRAFGDRRLEFRGRIVDADKLEQDISLTGSPGKALRVRKSKDQRRS